MKPKSNPAKARSPSAAPFQQLANAFFIITSIASPPTAEAMLFPDHPEIHYIHIFAQGFDPQQDLDNQGIWPGIVIRGALLVIYASVVTGLGLTIQELFAMATDSVGDSLGPIVSRKPVKSDAPKPSLRRYLRRHRPRCVKKLMAAARQRKSRRACRKKAAGNSPALLPVPSQRRRGTGSHTATVHRGSIGRRHKSILGRIMQRVRVMRRAPRRIRRKAGTSTKQ